MLTPLPQGHPETPHPLVLCFAVNLGIAAAGMGVETSPEKNNPVLNFQFVDYFTACEGSTPISLPCSIPLALKWGEGLRKEST